MADAPPEDAPADDAELLRRHAQGDPDAFAEVVRRHRDRLWAVALRTLADREEAADAVQDALVSAFRAAGTSQFRGEAAVTTWLHRIVVNACLDRLRRQAARPSVALADIGTDRSSEGASPARDETAQRDDRADIQAALARLPVEQRAALVLVDMQGWSVAEAAAALRVPEGTVKSRCARGRARLLPLLAPGRAAQEPPPGTIGTAQPSNRAGERFPGSRGGGA